VLCQTETNETDESLMKRTGATLPPPTKFLTLEEVAARWRRQPLTVDRLLREHFKIPTYRLTAKAHLYALADIEAIEEAAKHRAPLLVRSTWRQSPKASAAGVAKEGP
jgi:hypothetical protein